LKLKFKNKIKIKHLEESTIMNVIKF